MDLTKGACHAILKVGGDSLQDECKKKYSNSLNEGDIAEIKPAGKLKCKAIFLVVLPRCDGPKSFEVNGCNDIIVYSCVGWTLYTVYVTEWTWKLMLVVTFFYMLFSLLLIGHNFYSVKKLVMPSILIVSITLFFNLIPSILLLVKSYLKIYCQYVYFRIWKKFSKCVFNLHTQEVSSLWQCLH